MIRPLSFALSVMLFGGPLAAQSRPEADPAPPGSMAHAHFNATSGFSYRDAAEVLRDLTSDAPAIPDRDPETIRHVHVSTMTHPPQDNLAALARERRDSLDVGAFLDRHESEADERAAQMAEERRISEIREEGRRLIANPPPTSFEGASDLACMAIAVYHEARGEPQKGQMAVASVILQRARVPDRWGRTPCEVVQPVQFSFLDHNRRFARIRSGKDWARAIDAAARVLAYGPMPELQDADHYHANYVSPKWRHSMVRIERIGAHIFYRDPESRS